MNSYREKLKLILFPFIKISISTAVLYTLLYYILIIKLEFDIKDTITDFFVPFSIPWIPVLLWLKPRIKMLSLKNEKFYFFYQLVAAFLIFWFLYTSHRYLYIATSKITHIQSIKDFNNVNKTAFYKIKETTFSKDLIANEQTYDNSGKHNQYINFDIYFVTPIMSNDDKIDIYSGYKYWICKRYHIQESSRKSNAELNPIFEKFYNESESEFKNIQNLKNYHYFKRLRYSEMKTQGINGINKMVPGCKSDEIILFEPLDKNPKDNLSIKWVIISFMSGPIFFIIILITPKLKAGKI